MATPFMNVTEKVIGDPSGGNIDGDMIWWENNWARLEVTPHTSKELITQRQRAWLLWKTTSTDIDVAFRFDEPIRNGRIQRLNDVGEWVDVSMSLTVYGGKYYYRHNNFHVIQNTIYNFRWRYDTPLNSNGKWDLIAKLSSESIAEAYASGRYIMLDPYWWNGDWVGKVPITIDKDYVDSALNNFPVLVNVSSTISADCQSDGDDIRFVDENNNSEYYYDFDNTWNSATYNLIWVNVTNVFSDKNTVFYLYYDNPSATSGEDAANTWSTFLSVYHLNENTGSTVDDATGNNDAQYNGSLPSRVQGKAGYGQSFDSNGIIFYNTGSHISDEGSVELIVQDETPSGVCNYYFDKRDDDNSNYFRAEGGDYDIKTLFGGSPGWSESGGNVNDNWNYFSYNWSNGGNAKLHRNGVRIASANVVTTASYIYGKGWFGGRDPLGVDYNLTGVMDEIRISSTPKNESWFNATYDCIFNNSLFVTFGTASSYEVTVNETLGICTKNCTLHGFVSVGGPFEAGCWIGRTTPVTEDNADFNLSDGNQPTNPHTVQGGSNFTVNVTGLSRGTHYYVRTWVSDDSDFFTSTAGLEDSFYTKADGPTSLGYIQTGCDIGLTWTKGDGTVTTAIVRKNGSAPASMGDGTIVYNGSSSSYTDSSAAGYQHFYMAKSWGGGNWSDNMTRLTVFPPPCPPTSAIGHILSNNSLNISWVAGAGATNVTIVWKTGGYASSRADGKLVYTGNNAYWIDGTLDEEKYYSIWSFCGANYSSKVDINYGSFIVNCFDEDNNSLDFDIIVSRPGGGDDTYYRRNRSNPLIINVSLLPLGDDISVVITAAEDYGNVSEYHDGYAASENQTITYITLEQVPMSKSVVNVTCHNEDAGTNSYPPFTLDEDIVTINYDDADVFHHIWVNYSYEVYGSRTYYYDFDARSFYVLDAYLPDAALKHLYIARVVGPKDGEYTNPPVSGADIVIKKLIDGEYKTISTLISDANGEAPVYLVPDTLYKLTISKDDYITIYPDWWADPDWYGMNYPKTFELKVGVDPGDEPDPIYNFFTEVDFTTVMQNNGTSENIQGVLYISFNDGLSSMTDTQIYIYEYYNETYTLVDTDSRMGDNTFSYYVENIDVNRTHYVYLFFNSSVNFSSDQPLVLTVVSIGIYTENVRFDLEKRLESIFGPGPLGSGSWCPVISIIPAIFFLCLTGPFNTSFSILGAGLSIALMNAIFSMWLTNPFPSLLLASVGLIIAIGIIYFMVKDPGGHT